MINTKVYPNGLRLVVDEMKNFESCAFHILVCTGSVNEDESNYGISHFIEHMLFKGTEKRTASQIVRELDSLGANVNAYTDKSETVYYTKSTGDNVESCVEILSDMLYNSVFDEKEMSREKKVVLEEIAMYQDDAFSCAEMLASSSFYCGTPYAPDVAGTKKSVRGIKRKDIKEYMQRFYTPSNIVISFAGNITLKKAEKLVEKYFKTDECLNNAKTELKKCSPTIKSKVSKKYKDNEQSHICITYPALDLNDERRTALNVFNIAWGGGMSSLLFQVIREKLGLVYSIGCSAGANTAGGDTTIHFATTDKNVPVALKTIRQIIDEIVKNGIPEKTFETAKKYYMNSLKLAYENTSAVSLANAKRLAYLNKVTTKQEIVEKIEKVTNNDVSELVKKIYNNENFTISYVGKNTKRDLLKCYIENN